MIELIRAALLREMDRISLETGRKMSPKSLSRLADLNESAVRDILGKVKDPQISTILALARALDVPATFLFEPLVPICGLVGVDGIVQFLEDEPLEFAHKPPLMQRDLKALKVVGDKLRPAHRDGDVIFYSRQYERILPEFYGHECVAQLLDGSLGFLRILGPSPLPNRHSLRTFWGEELEDVFLAWASPVLFTARSLNGTKRS